MKRRLPLWSMAVLAALFVPMVAAHEPVFGMGVGLAAAGAGVAVGLLIALAATFWHWDLLATVAAALVGYLLGAGPAALRETTVGGVLPTWRTLQLSLVEAVDSWKDLLTITPPAASYTGPAVMPWLCGLSCALAAGLLSVRAGRYVLGTLPIGLMGVVGVAWGTGAETPLWPIVVWGLAVLAWWAWCSQRQRISSGEEILVGRRAVGNVSLDSGSATRTTSHLSVVHTSWRALGALLTLAIAGALAVPVVNHWPVFSERRVLRDVVVPPLDLQDYPTPLASFRNYTTALEKNVLLQVTGLPKDARMRLAVMDTYNGLVFGVSDSVDSAEGGYARVGRLLRAEPWVGNGERVELVVALSELRGPWIPTAGIPDALVFDSDGPAELQETLYFNRWSNAALSASFAGEASYRVSTVVQPGYEDTQLRGLETPPIQGTADMRVPVGIADFAKRLTVNDSTPLDQIRTVEQELRKGAYWNKDSSLSRPGHRAERLQKMLDDQQMVGDDEQYATLMALMLRSLGIPARVVMGAYPANATEPEQLLSLTGDDMHVWVEVQFAQVGWVAFDPTPNEDQVPVTDIQDPRPIPEPQVLQPPDPPVDPAELPVTITQDTDGRTDDEQMQLPWGVIAGAFGGALLLFGPLGLVLLVKASRTRRRRRAAPAASLSGSWSEVVDFAVDAGVQVPANLTRQESARLLDTTLWSPGDGDQAARSTPMWLLTGEEMPKVVSLARQADKAVFSTLEPTSADAAAAWADVAALRREYRMSADLLRRARRALSLRSLRR
ncbi:MAG: transglutaminase-like domain-containing protein, partial [Propionibacteriaceae bacterium]|nr:transglutaminase-like domain-containing protein [Propionibacteriaceae bacterium]